MKADRDENLLIGIHSVASALHSAPEKVRLVVIAGESKNPRVTELEQVARAKGVTVQHQPRSQLDKRCHDENRHQDILAEFTGSNLYGERDIEQLLADIDGDPLVLVLDGIQDPHNFGACLRTAEAAGVHFVVVPKDKSAGLSPVVRRSAAGAAEVISIVTVTNLARVLRQLKQAGIWLAGADGEARQSIQEIPLNGPLALVMGSEGSGMRRLTAEHCDYLIRIPMSGTVSSLNVSVATGVCLFEILRQRSPA